MTKAAQSKTLPDNTVCFWLSCLSEKSKIISKMDIPLKTLTGESIVMEILEGINPENVCNRVKVTYDSS